MSKFKNWSDLCLQHDVQLVDQLQNTKLELFIFISCLWITLSNFIVKWQDEKSNANSWNGWPYGCRYGVGKKTPNLWPWLTQSWNDKRHESSPVFYRHFFSLFSLCVPYQIQCEAWRKHYCATCNPMLTVHFPITYNFNRSDYFSSVLKP